MFSEKRQRIACWKSAIVIIAGVLLTNNVYAQGELTFELPLIVNKAVAGDISTRVTLGDQALGEETSASLPVARFKELVARYANREQLAGWVQDNLDTDYLSVRELRARGLEIEFDSGLLEIHAVVPRLGTQFVSLNGGQSPTVDNHFQQATLAAGFNYRLRDRYNHTNSRGNRKGFTGLDADLTGFVSYGGFNGWSLFYDANYDQNSDVKLAREDVTLVRDNFDRGMRLSIGDVRPTVSRFQSSPDLLGISYERDYSTINPFRNLRPSGRSSFTLDRESEVSFEVNGEIVSVELLPQGTYSISDFPLANGANNVRIFVDDGAGQVEVSNFSTYVDTSLLNVGVTNFGVTAGVRRKVSGSSRRREYGSEPVLLGFYEKGVTNNMTLAAQAEFSDGHALLSSSGVYGGRLGIVAVEAAVSKQDQHDSGFALLGQYSKRGISTSQWSYNYDAQVQYRSDRFISLGDLRPRDESLTLRAGATFSKSGSSYSIGGEFSEQSGVATQRLRLSHSRRIAGLSVALGYQYEMLDNGRNDSKLSLSIIKTFDSSRLRSQYKFDKRELRVDWSDDAARQVGQSSSRVSTIVSQGREAVDLNSRYIGSSFEANFKHLATMPSDAQSEDTYISTLTVSGAAGYADGAVAFGRPFNSGFMIVDKHKNLRGKRVAVRRGSLTGDTVTNFKKRGKTLVPLSNNYRSERYVFGVDDLPNGYDLGGGLVKLFPGASAGYRYPLGSDAANTVMGKLLWPDGTPLNLDSGKITPIAGGDSADIFTNRTGRFVADKMRFGEYKLVFGDENEFHAVINVAEGDEPGLVILGNITLEKAQ